MLEDAASLRNHNRPELHHLGTQHVGDVVSVEGDDPVLDEAVFRLEQAADGPQGRRLAGAVGPQQRDDAACGNAQAHAAQDLDDVVVNDFNVVDVQQLAVG